MGMIYCPECGKEISDKAKQCPNCGKPFVQNMAAPVPPPRKKKGMGCLPCILVFFVFIAVIAIATAAPSDKKKTEVAENGTESAAAEETDNSSGSQQEEEDQIITLGQEAAISDGLMLTVNSVTETDSISAADGYMSYKPDSGKYAVVNVTIRNTSKKSQQLLLNYFELAGPDDAKYVSTLIAVADDKFLTVDTVNPNLDITGNIVFEIPQDLAAADCRLQYSDYDLFNAATYFNLK